MWHLTYVYWDVIILPFDLWQLYYFVIANQPVTCWRQLAEVQNEHQNVGWGATEQSLTWWHVEVRMGRERQQGVKWPPITAKICRVASLNTQHLQSCGSIYHLHCIFICLSRLLLSAPFINSNQRSSFFGGGISPVTLSVSPSYTFMWNWKSLPLLFFISLTITLLPEFVSCLHDALVEESTTAEGQQSHCSPGTPPVELVHSSFWISAARKRMLHIYFLLEF